MRLGKHEPAVVDVFPGIPKGGVGFARKILTPTRFTVLRNALLLDEVSLLIHCPNRAALTHSGQTLESTGRASVALAMIASDGENKIGEGHGL